MAVALQKDVINGMKQERGNKAAIADTEKDEDDMNTAKKPKKNDGEENSSSDEEYDSYETVLNQAEDNVRHLHMLRVK
jgi:hypothetical protein